MAFKNKEDMIEKMFYTVKYFKRLVAIRMGLIVENPVINWREEI